MIAHAHDDSDKHATRWPGAAQSHAAALGWLSLLCVVLLLAAAPLRAAEPPAGLQWVATWAQPMVPNYAADSRRDNKASGQPILIPPPTVRDFTLRQSVRTSIGGQQVRIRLSNQFGHTPLHVTTAHVALHDAHCANLSATNRASDHALTFNGKHSITIAPGRIATSDPVRMTVPALSNLVVSLYFAKPTTLSDVHPAEAAVTTAIVAGNAVTAARLADRHPLALPRKYQRRHIFFLTGVDVLAPASTRVIVAVGDSITDGAYATTLAKPWPAVLATIANQRASRAGVAVINAGISGNELTTDQPLHPRFGMSGLKRFERDVIDQPGVTDVVVLFGANDINRGIGASGQATGARARDLIASLRMLADVAHAHHLRIYAGTITPFAGFTLGGWYNRKNESVRERVNHWIASTDVFDGVVPFAHGVRGTYVPSRLAAKQSPLPPGMATVCAGDTGLHPNDRGYAVMGTLAYNTLFQAQLVPAAPCH